MNTAVLRCFSLLHIYIYVDVFSHFACVYVCACMHACVRGVHVIHMLVNVSTRTPSNNCFLPCMRDILLLWLGLGVIKVGKVCSDGLDAYMHSQSVVLV